MEPVRVGQIIGKWVNGGVEAVVMNYYRHIDREKIQFDFVIDEDSSCVPPAEIERLGGRIYTVPPYQKLNAYIPALIHLFQKEAYPIVHAHINALNVFPLYAAKKAGVPVRISHSHSTAGKGEWKKNIPKYSLRPFARIFATHYAACSGCAGEWLFGKKAVECGDVAIFNNAIELDRFRFNEAIRNEVRKELGIEGRFVIGHVGRFTYQKNQEFVVDVFAEVYRQDPNAVLLLVGDGKDRARIEEKVERLRVWGGVIFLGSRSDADRLYQAMDVFLFPSRYEGLGMAAVEAQACGVRTIVSDAVPREAAISSKMRVLPLRKGPEAWAAEIRREAEREDAAPDGQRGYDITIQAQKWIIMEGF